MTTVVEAAYQPILQFFDDDGTFLVGGQLYTTVGGIPYPTYADAQGLVQHANPIILNSRGEIATSSGQSAQLYLIPDVTYTFALFDSQNNPIDTPTNVQGIPNDQSILALITQSFIGSVLYPQTAAEANVAVTPVFYNYEPGDIRRYGVLFDGSDETTKVQNWLSPGGNLTFPVSQSALITSGVIITTSDVVLKAVEGATIQSATHDLVLMSASQQSNIIIDGLTFNLTSAGTASGAALLLIDRCTYSTVQNCEFIGSQFYALACPGSTYCTIRNNYIHDALQTTQDTADIDLSSTTTGSNHNVVEGNYCYGGTEFGIACWDPDSGVLPSYNKIVGNFIGGGNTGYGILIYMPDAGDTFNEVIGNTIQDVSGTGAGNTSAGAGIYVVGAGAGGTKVMNNVIINCCINTADATLAPGGIGINGTSVNAAPLTISGNTIRGMTQYNGILLTGVRSGATVTGNSIIMLATNTNGDGISVVNSDNVSIANNTVNNLNSTSNTYCLTIRALGAAASNIAVTGNTFVNLFGGTLRTIQTTGTIAGMTTGIMISSNSLNGTGTGSSPLVLDSGSVANVMVTGNSIRASSVPAISQTACQFVRYANNVVISSGAVAASFVGTNTGGFFDKSNGGTGFGISNGGGGMIVEQLGQTAPTSGTWGIGDVIRNSAPSAGNVFEWVCTTAGTGGGSAVFKTVSNS